MKFMWHFITALIVFHLLWIPVYELKYGFVWFWALISALFPDADFKFKSFQHRSIFTHSLLFPLIIMYWEPVFGLFFGLVISIHLLCDIKFKKRGGFYTLSVLLKYRFKYTTTTIILFLNGIGGIALFIIFL